jgi:hypothetical protein
VVSRPWRNCRAKNGAPGIFLPNLFHNWISDRIRLPHSSGYAFQPEGWETTEEGSEVAVVWL